MKLETEAMPGERMPSSREVAPSRRRAQPLSLLMDEKPGSLQGLLPVMAKTLDAIACLDYRCNLDPRRILVNEDGSVGVSGQAEVAEDKTSVLGSFKYSSPELLQNDGSVSVALEHSYVLGFVFYELLLGRRLFDAEFRQVRREEDMGWLIWHADKNKRATPLRQLLPSVPAFVSEAIEKMMAKTPEERSGDLRGAARRFDQVSEPTATYKLLLEDAPGGRPRAGIKILDQSGHSWPRPWLVRLSEQQLWKALWRRVTPEDRRPGWASVKELEQMLQQAERMLGFMSSRTNLGQENEPVAERKGVKLKGGS